MSPTPSDASPTASTPAEVTTIPPIEEATLDAAAHDPSIPFYAEKLEFAQLLQTRFHHLTSLQQTTSRRHMTIIGATTGVLAAMLQVNEQMADDLVLPASFVLLLMSVGVVIYDSMIRWRLDAVAKRFAVLFADDPWLARHGPRDERGHELRHAGTGIVWRGFDEEYFFFSQIIAACALTPLPALDWLTGLLTDEFRILRLLVSYVFSFLVFSWGWYAVYRRYSRACQAAGRDWLPTA